MVKIKRINNANSDLDPGAVKEGTQLKLICEAEGNPEQFLYKWSVDDHNVNGRLLNLINDLQKLTLKYEIFMLRYLQHVDSGGQYVPDPGSDQGDAQHEGGVHCDKQ